ncbi:EAL domain-containing protein [Thiocystis violascens]|uniref:PAS domain S-box n=1 Tax=Thiocystis violascens (strain ATCC 17096 / DSM 198 / 6111) TaxID=765911 RepID=I3Y8K9_THIV6|nr:EAL domain-containing protein [Thiocystis violascens]AFL73327.1 PAS domain S-box [Thiocystis violascens DSM 198]
MSVPEQLRTLTDRLTRNGWERDTGARLAEIAQGIEDDASASGWVAALGRARELVGILDEFRREAPSAQRLAPVVQATVGLAELLERGPLAERLDPMLLPANPGDWTFVVAGTVGETDGDLLTLLRSLGFAVERADGIAAVEQRLRQGQTILLAGTDWLTAHAPRLRPLLPDISDPLPSTPLVVAVLDRLAASQPLGVNEDKGLSNAPDCPENAAARCESESGGQNFSAQIQARRAGARLVLDAPLEIDRLLGELAGLAWIPRTPYRVLLVDDDRARLADCTAVLSAVGCEVLASADPLAIWPRVANFVPETCVVGVGMADCCGIDFVALLRRDKRFTRLPAIYLAATDAPAPRIAACQAGGEEYFVAPLDHRLLTVAVLARARQFRLFEVVYFQRRRAWRELADLKNALDRHAIVSVASPDGAILDINRKFCESSGYRREELIGRNHRIVKSAHQAPAVFEGLWRTISAGRIWQGELQNRRKDGSHYWVQCTIAPILDERKRLERYLSIRTEISEQKSLLAQRKRHERLLDLQRRALQRFIATQDLAATATLLLDGLLILTDSAHGFLLDAREDADGTRFLAPQAISGIAWNAQTHRLLKTARAQGMEFRNLQNLLGDILHTGEAVIVNDLDGARIQGHLPDGHPRLHSFLGLPIREGDVLLGVLGLANRPGGYDRSEVEFLQTLTATYAGILDAARLRAVQQRVIDELQQTPSALEQTSQPPAPRAPTGSEPPARRRILIAEDNPANLVLLRMQIEALGHVADLAADGPTALAKWQAGGHDLLLTDLNMPGMDGLDLTRSIRAAEQEHGGHLPIIAITAASEPEVLTACRASGLDDILPKPIALDDLRRRLDRWLSRAAPDPLSAVPPEDPNATLDTASIVRALGNVSQRQMRELIDLFVMTARAELPACRNLRRESDARALMLAMHKLKSSAHMVGALHFAALAERLEEAARLGQVEVAPSLLAELDDAIGDLEAAAQRLTVALPPSLAERAPLPPEILPRRVLVLDDDAIARRQTGMLLALLGVGEILTVDSGEAALAEIERVGGAGIDLLITDLRMPGMDGIEFLRRLAASGYPGDLVISSGVDERLLHTAADLIRAKGLYLRGAIRKPMTRAALTDLLTSAREPLARSVQAAVADIAPGEILDGLRRDEFSMHFQPKVDANTLRVVGLEALARWRRGGCQVRPDLFIGAAERHGSIIPLSQALLAKTLNDGVKLTAAGFPLTIAFNLSADWLSDIHLPEFILDSIQTSGFAAENLILEITETTLLSDPDIAMDVLTRLRLKGFKLSIDDFGTGYSSMEQLRRIPFGELKLDRGFVRGASERPAVRAILSASVEMARKLGLTTVAEGVETQADLDLVRGLGCDLVQGWLIAKPMPLDELIAWLHARGMFGSS